MVSIGLYCDPLVCDDTCNLDTEFVTVGAWTPARALHCRRGCQPGADVSDKRRYPRLPVNLSATYLSGTRKLEARVSNLSQEGLSLQCEQVDPVGTTAEVAIQASDDNLLVLSGKVLWVHDDPDRPQAMGIGLSELDSQARQALERYLERCTNPRHDGAEEEQ